MPEATALGLSSDYFVNAVDVTTLAVVDSAMVSSTGSGYITPISTIYSQAEVAGASGGEALLESLGLNPFDLTYDPSATIATNANAATMLRTGASLLTMVSNAAALVSSAGAVSGDEAVRSVFSQIAALGNSINDLFDTKDTTGKTSQEKFTAVLKSSITNVNSSIDVETTSSLTDLITSTSNSVTAVTTALQKLDDTAIKAGAHLGIAATGQTNLLASLKSTAALVAAGDPSAAAAIQDLTRAFTSANVETLAATSAAKLAFNTQDPTNPIRTSADSVTISAPVESPVVQLFDILKNDTITFAGVTASGSAALDLAAVGIFTANARNGSITGSSANTITLENSASATANVYAGMSITLLTNNGPISRTISSYDGTSKVATLNTALTVSEQTAMGNTASYLISKALPSNLELAIVDDQLQITNRPATELSLEVGQLDLVYVAQKAGDPSIAKTGLVTVNVLPPKPSIAFASNTIIASEAVDGVTSGAQAPVTAAGHPGDFTVVDVPLTLTGGLGLTGTIQISGLPTGALLQVGSTVDGQAPMIIEQRVKFWTISQQDAPSADWSSLKVLIPSDLAGDYTLSAIATARYGGLASQSSIISLSLTVTPSADGLILASGDAGTLTAFFDQAVPDAVNEDTSFALTSSETTPAIDQLINALHLRRGDSDGSEFLGLKLELPKDWLASFTSSLAGSIITVQNDKTMVELYATDADATSLKVALAALRLTAALDYSGDATVKLTAGTFEATNAVNGIPSPANFKALPTSFNINVTVAPVSDTPFISTSPFAENWNQETYLRSDGFYSIPVSVKAVSTDTVTPEETLYLAVGKAELDAVGASLNVPAVTSVTLEGKEYLRFLASDEPFSIIVPSNVSELLTFSVLAGATDQGADFVYSSAQTVSIPFVGTPKTPSFAIKATSGYSEDLGVALSDLLFISPGEGRELATHKVFIKLPADPGYALSKSGVAIARTN